MTIALQNVDLYKGLQPQEGAGESFKGEKTFELDFESRIRPNQYRWEGRALEAEGMAQRNDKQVICRERHSCQVAGADSEVELRGWPQELWGRLEDAGGGALGAWEKGGFLSWLLLSGHFPAAVVTGLPPSMM